MKRSERFSHREDEDPDHRCEGDLCSTEASAILDIVGEMKWKTPQNQLLSSFLVMLQPIYQRHILLFEAVHPKGQSTMRSWQSDDFMITIHRKWNSERFLLFSCKQTICGGRRWSSTTTTTTIALTGLSGINKDDHGREDCTATVNGLRPLNPLKRLLFTVDEGHKRYFSWSDKNKVNSCWVARAERFRRVQLAVDPSRVYFSHRLFSLPLLVSSYATI